MVFELPQLSYAYNALEPVIDAQTMEIHHTLHHQAYVDNLNAALPQGGDVEEILRNLDKIPEDVRMKVRNNGGGHYNHSLFWQIMIPGGKPVTGKLAQAIGDLEGFKQKFAAAALARFGSGWVWLMPDLTIVSTPNQDSPIMDGQPAPILGLDVWEHAYYLKYQNRRADYVKAWWGVVDWEEVGRRYG